MKHYTSIEQSKKLLELGLNPETADMYFSLWEEDPDFKEPYMMEFAPFEWKEITVYNRALPCWSIGALLEGMPRVENNYPIMLRANNFKLTYVDKKEYCIHLETGSLLDVCYNMMIWLLENNYIKKSE